MTNNYYDIIKNEIETCINQDKKSFHEAVSISLKKVSVEWSEIAKRYLSDNESFNYSDLKNKIDECENKLFAISFFYSQETLKRAKKLAENISKNKEELLLMKREASEYLYNLDLYEKLKKRFGKSSEYSLYEKLANGLFVEIRTIPYYNKNDAEIIVHFIDSKLKNESNSGDPD